MNVKTGDFAIIIKAVNHENIGRIVSVGEFLGLFCGRPDCWMVDGAASGSVTPDAWLRPVSGLDDVDSIASRRQLEVH